MDKFVERFAAEIGNHYHELLEPLAEDFLFQRPPTLGELKRPPMVLLLGNHSSGKSTFVNFLLGIGVQKTGVAPTDDNFTIITHGTVDNDRDGPAVVSNPELPFEGLRHFGDQLVSHIRLKLRPADLLRQVTLIDSPGMIDEAKAGSGRGYDYPGAVRWFAERADLVVVFFDPEKPGTTGETLQVFNTSLTGIDHKLLIVMNKMDQFRNLHDFARAFGALCWNLGKVIARKDLPQIYNTYVPLRGQPAPVLSMEDFDRAREELVTELRRAPARRLDNMITQMQGFAERLRLHVLVIDEAARELRRKRWMFWGLSGLIAGGLAGTALVAGAITALPPIAIALVLAGALFEGVLRPGSGKRKATRLQETFERLYGRELLVRDRSDDLHALWDQVHPRTRDVATKRGPNSFPRFEQRDRDALNRLLDNEIPRLRSEVYARQHDATAMPPPPARAPDAAGTDLPTARAPARPDDGEDPWNVTTPAPVGTSEGLFPMGKISRA